MRCSQGWTGCREDHGDTGPRKDSFRFPLPAAKPRFVSTPKPARCMCDKCAFYQHGGAHRLERWRFGALKRLKKAGKVNDYSHSPLATASMLAALEGRDAPRCFGEAWEFLKGAYDPKVTRPCKSTRGADRRAIRR